MARDAAVGAREHRDRLSHQRVDRADRDRSRPNSIAGNSGIGFFISQMEQANRLPPMYAAIILTGIIGFILNTLYFTLEHKFVFWTPAAREQTS